MSVTSGLVKWSKQRKWWGCEAQGLKVEVKKGGDRVVEKQGGAERVKQPGKILGGLNLTNYHKATSHFRYIRHRGNIMPQRVSPALPRNNKKDLTRRRHYFVRYSYYLDF